MTGGRLGLIARADDGGLGNLTHAFAAWMSCDRIAVVEMPEPRGRQHWARYHGLARAVQRFTYGEPGLAEWITDGMGVVYTAEVPYDDRLFDVAGRNGCRVVLHAMPELHRAEYDAAEVWWPTSWLARGPVVPVPVGVPGAWEPRHRLRRLGIIGGPAMLDRNGVEMSLYALRQVTVPLDVHLFHLAHLDGKVTVPPNVRLHFHAPVDSPAAMYAEMDVLCAPRRYGGLSLLAQEAAAWGVPTIHLDREPDALWPGWSVPVMARAQHRMAGGHIDVCGTHPAAIADLVDRLASVPDAVRIESLQARAWAESLDWTLAVAEYRRLLGAG